MRVDLTLEVAIEQTPKVVQLQGIFDVPQAKRRTVDFHFDVPIEDKEWQIGLIVGPSGAGKTSVARHLFGDAIVESYTWPKRQSVVDGFGALSVRDATAALSAVGFSSPPAWTKPFHVLSMGEKFRATLARALVDDRDLVVLDEFTSVVDRTVARIGSHAVAKAVRKQPKKRFVAVSCHDDIVEWLQPDWILEPHVGRFRWRSVQRRPSIDLEIVRCDHSAWRWFAPHHYLTAELHRGARCFVGLIEGIPVAFAGLIHFPHATNKKLENLSRIVVMPDYQGLGLGAYYFAETIAKIVKANDNRMIVGTAHPALIKTWARSRRWRMVSAPSMNRNPSSKSRTSTEKTMNPTHTLLRRVANFHYAGPGFTDPADIEMARQLWKSGGSRTAAARTKARRGRIRRRRKPR